jgi:lipopolysaccharide export system permease protein
MKINSIINRYLFIEMVGPFVINLVFFTFIFLMAEMLKITDLIVNYGVGIFTILMMLVYSTPYFLIYVIPMSIMMAVLLTFMRMSGDNEIIALKTGGISIYRLLPPVIVFCLAGCLLTAFMTVYGQPWGRSAVKKLTFKVVSSSIDLGLKERTFNDSFKDVMFYVNEIDLKNRTLIDVFIEDKRTKSVVSTVIAPKGKLFSEPGGLVYHLRLYDGIINQADIANRSAHSLIFKTYDIRLDLKKNVSAAKQKGKSRKEMSLNELRQYLEDTPSKNDRYYKALMELHKKFSISIACFTLGFLAVSLGIQSRSSKKSYGLVLGLVFFLIYYLLLSFGLVFGETGAYPPVIGIWLPNYIMGGLGLYLLYRTANERSVRIDFLAFIVKKFNSRFSR